MRFQSVSLRWGVRACFAAACVSALLLVGVIAVPAAGASAVTKTHPKTKPVPAFLRTPGPSHTHLTARERRFLRMVAHQARTHHPLRKGAHLADASLGYCCTSWFSIDGPFWEYIDYYEYYSSVYGYYWNGYLGTYNGFNGGADYGDQYITYWSNYGWYGPYFWR